MSDILKTVHKTVKGLRQAGVIDKTTMGKFDTLCFKLKVNKGDRGRVESGRK